MLKRNKSLTPKGERRVLHELNKRVSLRKTHLTMYRVLMIFAIVCVALSVNLYYSKPTFNPYDIEKETIALVFLVLGVGLFVFLNFWHNLRFVRLAMAVTSAFLMFWGISNTQQAFAGKASFQLPILLIGFALILLVFLVEPRTNPMTSNGKIGEEKK